MNFHEISRQLLPDRLDPAISWLHTLLVSGKSPEVRADGEMIHFSRAPSIVRLIYPFAGSEASHGDRDLGPELRRRGFGSVVLSECLCVACCQMFSLEDDET